MSDDLLGAYRLVLDHNTGRVYALKVLDESELKHQAKSRSELYITKAVQPHPNVIRFVKRFKNKILLDAYMGGSKPQPLPFSLFSPAATTHFRWVLDGPIRACLIQSLESRRDGWRSMHKFARSVPLHNIYTTRSLGASFRRGEVVVGGDAALLRLSC